MSDAPNARRAELASRLLVAILVGLFILGLVGFIVAVLDADRRDGTPAPPSLPSGSLDAGSPVAKGERFLLAMADPQLASAPADGALGAEASSQPSDASSPPTPSGATAAPASAAPAASTLVSALSSSDATADAGATIVAHDVPVVPVVGFWSNRSEVSRRDLVRALERGELAGSRRLIVEDGIRDGLTAALGIQLHPDVLGGDLDEVGRVIRRGGLALVAAPDLRPSMRPLRLDGRSLVGNERVRSLGAWPLVVSQPRPADDSWDQARTWVLVAGGDSFTDRGVYGTVVRKGRGVEFPFDGGTATVTAHVCCDPVFNDNEVPRYVLTGNRGMVRDLFRDAELAIANHEMPVTEAWDFHTSGLRFSGKPELTQIFARAGIDWMSLANNHIKDYGTEGILDSRRILRRNGIASGGAGADLDQARRISYLDAGGTKLAIIPCLGVVPIYFATPTEGGATPCLDRYLVPDIKAAARRADVVLVFPHWGVEYSRRPMPGQRDHAARWVKAGADLVLGAHSHVAGAIEDIAGVPVVYSLGNLIFDQHWSTNTMESMLVQATFHGDRLVTLDLVPYIIHDQSQPNLLDPTTGEGRSLRQQVREASSDWLDW
jgi:poly-gamma-glutamate synthesis protein (capsule biosynthesis protein)